ncbi:MAG TPA: hypothetical protein VIH53_00785, partial [Gemmatimonadaceae bacterium]
MRRPNLFSPVPSLLKMSFAGAFALAFIISCSDSTGPSLRFPASVQSVYVDVPDSLKSYWLNVSDLTVSGDVAFAPRGAALSVADAPWKYSLSHPAFEP